MHFILPQRSAVSVWPTALLTDVVHAYVRALLLRAEEIGGPDPVAAVRVAAAEPRELRIVPVHCGRPTRQGRPCAVFTGGGACPQHRNVPVASSYPPDPATVAAECHAALDQLQWRWTRWAAWTAAELDAVQAAVMRHEAGVTIPVLLSDVVLQGRVPGLYYGTLRARLEKLVAGGRIRRQEVGRTVQYISAIQNQG